MPAESLSMVAADQRVRIPNEALFLHIPRRRELKYVRYVLQTQPPPSVAGDPQHKKDINILPRRREIK